MTRRLFIRVVAGTAFFIADTCREYTAVVISLATVIALGIIMHLTGIAFQVMHDGNVLLGINF